MLKPFGVAYFYDYGIECGIVMAESKEECKEIVNKNVRHLDHLLKDEEVRIIPIDPEIKGYFEIGEFEE